MTDCDSILYMLLSFCCTLNVSDGKGTKISCEHLHLSDAFIQSNLQLHSGYTFSLVCVFPGNRTHNLLRCWRNALPLSHSTAQVNSTDVSFSSCPIHHTPLISTRPYHKTHTFTHKSTHTQTHWISLSAIRNECHVHRHTRRGASSHSSQVLLSQACVFISSPLPRISSIYCSQTQSDWFLPNLMPQAAT